MTIAPAAMFAIQAGVALAGTAASIAAQAGQARAQTKINARAADEAERAAQENYQALQKMAGQEAENTSQQLQEVGDEARAAASSARVAAGEAGVSGLSVDALLRDLYGDRERLNSNANMQLDRTVDQLNSEARGVQSGTQSRLNSLTPVSPEDWLSPTAQAGAGIAGAWRDNFKITPRDIP